MKILINKEKISDLSEKYPHINISSLPITTGAIIYPKLATIILFFLHSISLLIPSTMILTFFSISLKYDIFHWRILLLFIDVLSWWGLYLILSLLIGKLFLIVLTLLHKPKEGLFKVDFKNKDYYFYCLRVSIKKFIFWIWNNFCFPWVNNFAFKICDMRADFKSTLFDGWSDVEFIHYGNNIMLGQGAVVSSCLIIDEYLIIKKVHIGDHVVLGGNCIIAPGTTIGKNCTVGVHTITNINQHLESNWIYVGRPAKKYKHINEKNGYDKMPATRRIVDTGEKLTYDIHQFKKINKNNLKK